MKTSTADQVVSRLDQAGTFIGKLTNKELDLLAKLLKQKRISLKSNNLGTEEIFSNACIGAVFGAALGYIFTQNYSGATCGAAIGGSVGYLFSKYSISVSPTGERGAHADPIWAVEIVPA